MEKTKLIALVIALMTLNACASLSALSYGTSRSCYVPRDRNGAWTREAANLAHADCAKKFPLASQMTACMYEKGFDLEVCDHRTNQPIEGDAVTYRTSGLGSLERVPNEVSLKGE